MRVLVLTVTLLTLGLGLYVAFFADEPRQGEVTAQKQIADVLGNSDIRGYTRATQVRTFSFPADHAAHPDFKHEWWYFTGNLDSTSAGPGGSGLGGSGRPRHFGFQLTFFRIALSAEATPRASSWATNQIFMAHFTLTDVESGKFYQFERFSRVAAGLAGVSAEPFRVWLEDWSASASMREPAHGSDFLQLRLHAAQDDVAIDLVLDSRKPLVLQGDSGLSQKSSGPGNASYYYSLTRLITNGSLRIGTQQFKVQGLSWMDREWSSSALGRDQAGWDWFSLQLGDGRELMFYRLRRRDGSADPFSAGSLIAADGSTLPLALKDIVLDELEHWESPHTGDRYPSRWRLRVPSQQIDLSITPYLADQELRLAVHYWEGAARVQGSAAGKAVTGNAYVEMTGY